MKTAKFTTMRRAPSEGVPPSLSPPVDPQYYTFCSTFIIVKDGRTDTDIQKINAE